MLRPITCVNAHERLEQAAGHGRKKAMHDDEGRVGGERDRNTFNGLASSIRQFTHRRSDLIRIRGNSHKTPPVPLGKSEVDPKNWTVE